MSDKRSMVRSRSYLTGKIVYNHGACTLECVVRNMSATGAKLQVSEAVTVPAEFDLVLSHNDQRRASLRWRSGDEVGVEFVSAGAAAGRPGRTIDDMQRRIEDLEEENARLRALIEAALSPTGPAPPRRKIA
jgi:hypothetical protein